jgi:hypothetical protein
MLKPSAIVETHRIERGLEVAGDMLYICKTCSSLSKSCGSSMGTADAVIEVAANLELSLGITFLLDP